MTTWKTTCKKRFATRVTTAKPPKAKRASTPIEDVKQRLVDAAAAKKAPTLREYLERGR